MLNGGDTLSMGWLPEQGFLKHRWDIYAELTTMYLLAISSPTHPVYGGELGGAAAADCALWRDRLHHGCGAAVHPPVSAGLGGLSRYSRQARELLHQFDCGDAGTPALVPGAGAEIPLD